MTQKKAIDEYIVLAVTESMAALNTEWGKGGKALESGDVLEDCIIRTGMESPDSRGTCYDALMIEQRHVDSAKAIVAKYPLGFNDPAMPYGF